MDRTKLQSDLVSDEGKRRFPYYDSVGKLTIGVGHNLTDLGLSDAAINFILNEDIENHLAELRSAWPAFDSLDEVRQRVLANMAFNLGVAGLLQFKNTLAAIETGDYIGAAVKMRSSKWAKQVCQRAERLAVMMATGQDT